MHLLVKPSGGKYWRLKYRYGGKEKILAFGVYSDVRLPYACKRRADAKASLADNRDPGFERKSEKLVAAFRAGNTFEGVAGEWWKTKRSGWSVSHTQAMTPTASRSKATGCCASTTSAAATTEREGFQSGRQSLS